MQALILIVQALHVLPAVFWAGTTFVLARGIGAERLVFAQVGSGALAILAGMGLWRLTHWGTFGRTEQVLAAGAACAIVAYLIQLIFALPAARRLRAAEAEARDRPLRQIAAAERLASLLLAVTLVCMVATRYV